jgi:hypothetical protein
LRNNGTALSDSGCCVVRETSVHFGRDAAGNDVQNLLAKGDGEAFEGQVGHGLVGCAVAELLAGIQQHSVHDGLILRHLGGGGNQRWVGGGVLGAKLLHRLNIAGVGDDHGVLAQLLKQILRHVSSWGRALRLRSAYATSLPLFCVDLENPIAPGASKSRPGVPAERRKCSVGVAISLARRTI